LKSPESHRIALLAERDALLAEDHATDEDRKAVTLDQQAQGRLSRMDALQRQAMAQAVARRRDGRIARIDAALKRIDANEFGFCEDCGDDIAAARLAHDPTVLRCIDCAKG